MEKRARPRWRQSSDMPHGIASDACIALDALRSQLTGAVTATRDWGEWGWAVRLLRESQRYLTNVCDHSTRLRKFMQGMQC